MFEMAPTTILLLLVSCVGLVVADNNEKKSNLKCPTPFQEVGRFCLLVDNTMIGGWTQVRQFCKDFKGDLVNMQDANILYDIVQYLDEKMITKESFWIGAYDLLDEGQWVWSWNNTDVQMETPLWGVEMGRQEPNGGSKQNCAILNSEYYYYVFDEDCNKQHSAICSPSESTDRVEHKSEPHEAVVPDIDCPYPFVPIGDSCLMVDGVKLNPWSEQMKLCQAVGGHLAKIVDVNIFGDLFHYLEENGVDKDLWLGGTDTKEEDKWVWLDDTPVHMGTPFWGEDVEGTQEPAGGRMENCLALAHKDFFFFEDMNCDDAKGFVCQYD